MLASMFRVGAPKHCSSGLLWQDDVPAPEESAGRPRRAVRSAQAKSTMAKLGAPKAVGLPKPPQILAKVRELVVV